MEQWIEKAEALIKADFRIYGIGNFDISTKEVAEILKLLSENKFDELKNHYKKLYDKRMG
jgi:hypothetical protein